MSSTSSRRPAAAFRSRAVALATWKRRRAAKAMRTCFCMLRKYRSLLGLSRTLLTSLSGPDPKMVEKAKELCEDLLANVREQYEEFKSRPPRSYGGYGGRGGDSYHGYNRDSHSHHHNSSHSYGNSPAPGAGPSASPPSSNGTPASAADYAAHYAQYYGTDPYAPYGGYQAYVQMYQQWMASQAQASQAGQQQGGTAAPPATTASAPGTSASPPPPPSEAAPPPPPPPSSAAPPPPPPSSGPPGTGSTGGYSAVCFALVNRIFQWLRLTLSRCLRRRAFRSSPTLPPSQPSIDHLHAFQILAEALADKRIIPRDSIFCPVNTQHSRGIGCDGPASPRHPSVGSVPSATGVVCVETL